MVDFIDLRPIKISQLMACFVVCIFRCVATVLTPELQAGMKYNETEAVTVGGCDKGPLIFNMQAPPGKNMVKSVLITIKVLSVYL